MISRRRLDPARLRQAVTQYANRQAVKSRTQQEGTHCAFERRRYHDRDQRRCKGRGVVLEGSVVDSSLVDKAGDLAKSVPGVGSVKNDLIVREVGG
jgi:osmotically-inducible protein OsmY